MGNSSTSFLPANNCFDVNLSRDSVTPAYWDSFSINDDFKNSSITLAVILLLFLLISFPSNVVIIVTIIQQKLYKEPTHILLLNLAVSDIFVCILVMPMVIVAGFAGRYIFGGSDYVRCQVCQTGLILIALILISAWTIGFLSLDRFIYIKFPMRYSRYVTAPRTIILVCVSWIFAVSVSVIPLTGFGDIRYSYSTSTCIINLLGRPDAYFGIILLVLSLIPIVVAVVTNIWIACLVRKEIGIIYKIRKTFSSMRQLRTHTQKQIRRKKSKKQLMLVRVFGAILIACILVWLPPAVQIILLLTIDPDDIPLGMYVLVYLCLILHSVLHPLIEGCFIPEIKTVFKSILGVPLCRKCCAKRADVRILCEIPAP